MMHQNGMELVIPTYNRLEVLRDTLRHIRVLYAELPICLGIQGEAPEDMVRAWRERDKYLRIERLPRPGTTRALNHCINTSRADIVLIIDDDAIPCPGWLESHVRALTDDPALSYTCGREIRMRNGRTTYTALPRIMAESLFRPFLPKDVTLQGRIIGWTSASGLIFGNYDRPGTCRVNTPRGCNMAVRRAAVLSIGGFNESFLGNAWGFEADFGLRIEKAGGTGRYLGDAAVQHYEVPGGGSRHGAKRKWYRDYLHNHGVLIEHLGPQAWIGSVPRLLKRALWVIVG